MDARAAMSKVKDALEFVPQKSHVLTELVEDDDCSCYRKVLCFVLFRA